MHSQVEMPSNTRNLHETRKANTRYKYRGYAALGSATTPAVTDRAILGQA